MMLNEFIAYLLEQVANHSIYVWGAQGQKAPTVCEAWIRRREQDTGGEKINGKYRTYADIAVDFWKKQVASGYGNVLRAFDCSGLVVYWLLKMGMIDHDMTANGLYGLCKPTKERRAGYWVFRISDSRAVHIGALIDDHTVIHAKGRAYGVVKEEYRASYWHAIGIPRVFDFSESIPEPEPGPVPVPAPEPSMHRFVKVVGGSVNVRKGNGTKFARIGTAHNARYYREHGIDKPGDELPCFGQADTDPYWYEVEFNGERGYISANAKYTEIICKV